MKKIFIIIILFSFFKSTYGQATIDTIDTKSQITDQRNNMISFFNLGRKSTFGFFGLFYGHRVQLSRTIIEMRIGGGIKESIVLGGGINIRVFNNEKWFESFIATDYSYNFAGTIRFDDEKAYRPYTSDQYKFTECTYIHTFLISRFFISENKSSAIQLKTGYTFLLNPVTVIPTSGPNVNYSKAKQITASGLMLGIDLLIFFP